VIDREAAWNPWVVDEEWEPETEHLLRAKVAELSLDELLPGWSVPRPVDVSVGAFTVFYVLALHCDSARVKKLAGLLGASELLNERGEG